MKILIANSSYKPNTVAGAEKVVETLGENLTGRGHEVVIVTTQPQGGPVTRKLSGVTVHYLPVANVYRPFTGARPSASRKALWHLVDTYNPFMSRAFSAVLGAERPAVVNTHNMAGLSTSVMMAVRRQNLPLVHTMHDQYLLCPKGTMFKNDRNCVGQCADCRIYSAPRRWVSQGVDVAVGVSRFILERHLAMGFFRSSDAKVIHNGLGLKSSSQNQSSNPRTAVRFGFLGQLRSTKGVHRLIAAFMAECATDAELWIAGKGDDVFEAELKALSAHVPTIRWLGFTHAAAFLDEIDVLVVPSLWNDTAPLVVLEASAHGVPVLGSNRGGIPELVNSRAGWIFDPDVEDSLRQSLRHCIEQRANFSAMSRAAVAHSGSFNLDRFIDEYETTYEEAIRRKLR